MRGDYRLKTKDTSIGADKPILSFTTIASRIEHIRPMVDSILKQTIRPDRVELYISDHRSIFPAGIDEGIKREKIPRFLLELEEQGQLYIEYVDNIGPANKLIPALRKYKETDNIIITVDDDFIYPANTIEKLLNGYRQEKCAVTSHGRKPLFSNGKLHSNHNLWPVVYVPNKHLYNFGYGCGGGLYKSSFFCEKVFDTDKLLELTPLDDDVWFYFTRITTQTPILIIGANLFGMVRFVSLPSDCKFLHHFNDSDNYRFKSLAIEKVADWMGYEMCAESR